MEERVKEELTALGYTPTADDDALISVCITKVSDHILNDINQSEIPEKLISAAVDMVCGEFLNVKKTFSPDSLEALDLSSAAVKRIQVGDTSTEFAADTQQSASNQLDGFISRLMSNGKKQLSCFRKLRW